MEGYCALTSRRLLFRLATSDRFERAVRSVAPAEGAARRAARRYVAGDAADDALAVARELADAGMRASIDLFGEQVSDPGEARAVGDAYVDLARRLDHGTWLSIDLSHVGLDVSTELAREALERIAGALPAGARLQVGGEDSARAERILEVVLTVARAGAPVTATVLANLRRSAADGDRLASAGVPIRLVKGAYVEPPALAFAWGDETDVNYLRLARALGEADLALATHDRVLREALPDHHRHELLLGVRPGDAHALARQGRDVTVYVPYGAGWFRYWMRRVAESRGA